MKLLTMLKAKAALKAAQAQSYINCKLQSTRGDSNLISIIVVCVVVVVIIITIFFPAMKDLISKIFTKMSDTIIGMFNFS